MLHLMGSADTVVVQPALIKIAGRIHFHDLGADTIQVPAGHRLRLELPFRFIEVSRKRDDFYLELTSTVAGTSADSAAYEHTDRMGVPDDHEGTIVQEYDALPAGRHELTFRVHAEYNEGKDSEADIFEGTVPITVA